MQDSRVRSGAESIAGPGAYSHANVSVSGESGQKPNLFTDSSAAKANPSARIHYSYIDTDAGAHENGADHDNPVTRASAYLAHGEGEENRDDVALKAIESGRKRACKDNNVGTKQGKTRRSHQADDLSGIRLANSYSSGKHTIVSSKNQASNASDEEPISSFETPDSYNSSEETSDDEQVIACSTKAPHTLRVKALKVWNYRS
ncbi:hypothetical protein OXX69_010193 [Metschnikowia pulcherrima]